MSIKITNECVNCGACVIECPNNAIYEDGMEWSYSDGTNLKGILNHRGKNINAREKNEPLSYDYFYIVPEKCTECKGFHDIPQCAAVCPVDCCIKDEKNIESINELNFKKNKLHCE